MITQITIDSIFLIVQEILGVKRECNDIMCLIKGERKEQKINNEYIKFIFNEVSSNIKTVVIDCVQGKVKSISFYGTLGVNPAQLYLKYKHFQESYSIHDDLYFYSFNENSETMKYSISFFDPNHKKINIEQNNEGLHNLQINL